MINMIIHPGSEQYPSIVIDLYIHESVQVTFCIFQDYYFQERTIESEIDRDKIFLCFSYFSLKGIR